MLLVCCQELVPVVAAAAVVVVVVVILKFLYRHLEKVKVQLKNWAYKVCSEKELILPQSHQLVHCAAGHFERCTRRRTLWERRTLCRPSWFDCLVPLSRSPFPSRLCNWKRHWSSRVESNQTFSSTRPRDPIARNLFSTSIFETNFQPYFDDRYRDVHRRR